MLDDAFSLKMSSLNVPPTAGPPNPVYQPGPDRPNLEAYTKPEVIIPATVHPEQEYPHQTSSLHANPFSTLPGYTDRHSFRNPPPVPPPREYHSVPTPGYPQAHQTSPYSSLRASSELPRYTGQPAYHTNPALYRHLSPRSVDLRGPYGLYGESLQSYGDLTDKRRHSSKRHYSKRREEHGTSRRGEGLEGITPSRDEELRLLRQHNDAMQMQLMEQKRDLEQALAAVGQPRTEIV